MGNRLCKSKKSDVVDNAQNVNNNNNRSPSKFDRIINRLHLKPATWKSESHLNKKEGNRSKSEEIRHGESIFYTKPLSKSSDWTDVDLEVPLKDDEHIHLRNPKLSLIFDNDKGTPTPPPRKQQKSNNIREKIERIAKNTLQAVQGDKSQQENRVPVEEPLIVKRHINYKCPLCDDDENSHNRNHHHQEHAKKPREEPIKIDKDDIITKSKNSKRKKNLSVVSLPNYTDLKLSVADSDPLDHKATSRNGLNSSRLSLQTTNSKKLTSSQSTGKLDTYITRCRSFGSILPQQLKKFMPQKPKPVDITSDDSFGALEDWDLGLIEHYNPKDASLPRPRKSLPPKPSNNDVLSDIESLVVKEEDIQPKKPKTPRRKVDSLVKKFNREALKEASVIKKAPEEICLTPPPSPVSNKKVQSNFTNNTVSIFEREFPPVVERTNKIEDSLSKRSVVDVPNITLNNTAKQDRKDPPVEHSSLMRILQEFSVKDKHQEIPSNIGNESNFSSLTPSLVEFEKTLNNSLVEDFINAEKSHTKAVCS